MQARKNECNKYSFLYHRRDIGNKSDMNVELLEKHKKNSKFAKINA